MITAAVIALGVFGAVWVDCLRIKRKARLDRRPGYITTPQGHRRMP